MAARYVHRIAGIGVGIVSQLAGAATSPTFGVAGREQDTGVVSLGGYLDYIAQKGTIAVGGDYIHRVGGGLVGGISAPESPLVLAPALDVASPSQGAGMVISCGNGGYARKGAATAVCDHIHRIILACVGVVSQLVLAIVSPTFDPARSGQCTAILVAQADLGDSAKGGGAAIAVHDVRGEVNFVRVAVAFPQFAIIPVPPAHNSTGTGDGTGVQPSHIDLGDVGDGGGAAVPIHRIHRSVAVGGIVISQLAEQSVAPALDLFRSVNGAGVQVMGGDLSDTCQVSGEAVPGRYIVGIVRIGVGSISQLSIISIPPTFDSAGRGDGA